MERTIIKTRIVIILGILIGSCTNIPEENRSILSSYPEVVSNPKIENYFGVAIKDDYRNLENLTDSSTTKWFKEQSHYAKEVLNNISGRDELIEKFKSYDDRKKFDTYSYNVTLNGKYFFLRQEKDDDFPKLYYRENFEAVDELLFDSKDFKPEKSFKYGINYVKPSWDGSYVAVALSYNGSEISEMIIIDMNTRKRLPHIIDHCWPSDGGGVSWLPKNDGFIYLHYPVIDPSSKHFLKNMKAVVYKLGNDPKDLNVLFSKESQTELQLKEEDFPIVQYSDPKDKYILGTVDGATAYHDSYYAKLKDLELKKINWNPLFSKEDKVKKAAFHNDSLVYISAKNSPNFQILSRPLNQDAHQNSTTILANPEENEIINDFEITLDGIYFTTTKNGVQAKMYQITNDKIEEIQLPIVSGRINISVKSKSDTDIWLSTMGWLNNKIRYKFNSRTKEFTEEMISRNGNYPEFKDFVVKEITVSSHDGEEIPLSIIHKKDIKLNGENPTLIYGYGSYGFSIRPFFSPSWLTWVEEGGVLCFAHVRGGGEKGDSWYEGGKKKNKPNSWKDLISCTEYLIKEEYTSKKKTVINGGSAGGILIGRAMTERPDLFAVAISEVGVMNILRSETTSNGPNNVKEFGTVQDSLECGYLIEMDAYHHVETNEEYPATLITVGMNDPRVVPWLSGKFVAKLQNKSSSTKPIIFSVDYESGHGRGDSRMKQFRQKADMYAFAFWQTGHKDYSFKKSLY